MLRSWVRAWDLRSYSRVMAQCGGTRWFGRAHMLLFATTLLCLPRGSLASSRRLLNRKVFELRASLELLSQPHGLSASSGPGVSLFDRNPSSLQPTPSASASIAHILAKPGKLVP